MAEKGAGAGRGVRGRLRDVSLTRVGLVMAGTALFKFLGSLLVLVLVLVTGSGFSAGKLLDAVAALVCQLGLVSLVLWLLARLRARGARPSTGG
ncbi:hypothetical protein [Streptomyces sp. NPDC101237]|uniref:hypothetical protein n=1 Tax=Streptomyces sp. NPDC101237 TaxID=3366139 RepID=UPI0037FE344D